MCNHIFKKGENKGKKCPVNQRQGEYCSRHKASHPQQEMAAAWNGKCKHVFKQGSREGVQCTTKPRTGEYCSRHQHLHLPQLQPKSQPIVIVKEEKERKCAWKTCTTICSMKGGLSDKYCDLHMTGRDHIRTIYRPEHKGDYMYSTGFILDINNSRYRPEDVPWGTDRVIGKVVGGDRGIGGTFVEKLDDDELQFCKDIGLIYQPRVPKLVRANAFHDKVCDLCWKFCCTVSGDVDHLTKTCRTCDMNKVSRNPNFDKAYLLVGTKCNCEWCQVADEEEPEFFDEYLYPYRFERDPRVKCKIPMCPYHVENKRTKMCSLCDEGRVCLYINREDPSSEQYRQHIGSNMILKLHGETKMVIGKTEALISDKILKEITPFDMELINDFGWTKSDEVKVCEVSQPGN